MGTPPVSLIDRPISNPAGNRTSSPMLAETISNNLLSVGYNMQIKSKGAFREPGGASVLASPDSRPLAVRARRSLHPPQFCYGGRVAPPFMVPMHTQKRKVAPHVSRSRDYSVWIWGAHAPSRV